MKSTFSKEDRTGIWIATAITAALAAGTCVWFYLRGKRAAEAEAYRREHARDYLAEKQRKKKKHRTDVHELGGVIQHPQA